jgi:dihydrofolate synthase/folylpolyglutamate synthase
MMTYPDSVRFLYALGNEIKTAKLGLDRIRAVLAALGNPQDSFRSIHVAGTNGKGSTCAMIDAGLRTAGIRTGLFTSPHLIEPTERIVIDGMPVTTRQFEQAFDVVHKIAGELDLDFHPTYFETVTAMAFWLFRELRVETAVVETGLGGRLDATNVLNPTLTVITPIDFDHEAYLGGTIEAIAAEKAGILKTGVPAIFARQRPEAQKVLDQRAAALNIPVKRTEDYDGRDLIVTARGSHFSGIHVPLAGEHQVENAIAAALALESLAISPKGIEHTIWPGRLEHISPNPDIILDGAHNPAGARALVRYLERFYAGRKLWLIYGAMRDKSVDEIAGILFPLASRVILTAPDNARALRPEAVAELTDQADLSSIAPDILTALQQARKEITENDVIVITGSLFLVGEARALSYNKHSWPFSGAWSS